MTSPRPWSVGRSALCRHTPRCANIFEAESCADVTFPCSGLSVADAMLIVAVVNAVAPGDLPLPADLAAVIAAAVAEWRRVAELAREASRAQGKGGD